MLGNLVLEMCNAPGTAADCNLLGPTSGRLPFGFWFASGAQCFYVLSDGTQSEWGIGTYTAGSPNKLNRTTVLKNSANSTARLNFLGSTKVYNETPAERELWIDNSGNLVINGQVIVQVLGVVKSGGANLYLSDPAAALDRKIWDFVSYGGNLDGRAINDTYSATNSWLSVWRTTGTAIAGITLKTAVTGAINLDGPVYALSSLNVTGALAAAGAVSTVGNVTAAGFGAQVTTTSATPLYLLKNTAGPADQKTSYVYQDSSGNIGWQFVNDAGNAGGAFFNVTRSGITPLALTLTAANVYNTGNLIVSAALTATGIITGGSRIRAATGNNGFQANTASSYLTINGSTDFNSASNFILNGGARAYAFEWYWGANPIALMDNGGNMQLADALYVATGTGAGTNFRLYGTSTSRIMRFRSDGWQWQWNNNGDMIYAGPDAGPGVVRFYCDSSGNLWAQGTVHGSNVFADERTKRDIAPYNRGLADLIQLKPVRYKFNGLGGTNDDGAERVGLIAQQARPHVPECVWPAAKVPTDEEGTWIDRRLPDQLNLDDGPLLFAAINALRELHDLLTDTREQLGVAVRRIVQLESRAAALPST